MRHYSIYCLLLLVSVMTSCRDDDDPIAMNVPDNSSTADTMISFLALGDSYTVGTSVSDMESWPAQLALAMDIRERIRVDPLVIRARNGWRTDNLINALAASPPSAGYDLVSLQIGVNDQYQGFSVSGYADRFETLLQMAIGYANGDTSGVFVVSIPDYAYTPFGGGEERISIQVDEFNRAARSVALRYDIPVYDITPISRLGLDEPRLVADDGLHPSGAQYRRWVEEVLLPLVVARLRRDG